MANALLDARQQGDCYRRAEVITEERRQRRWTGERKALDRGGEPCGDANISELAQRNGARGQLTVWRRQLTRWPARPQFRADPNCCGERRDS